jgi:hypothetical protein
MEFHIFCKLFKSLFMSHNLSKHMTQKSACISTCISSLTCQIFTRAKNASNKSCTQCCSNVKKEFITVLINQHSEQIYSTEKIYVSDRISLLFLTFPIPKSNMKSINVSILFIIPSAKCISLVHTIYFNNLAEVHFFIILHGISLQLRKIKCGENSKWWYKW